MRVRSIGAVVLVGVILAAVASTASGAPTAQSATLTVWLQVDAQATNWEPIVKAANAQFQRVIPASRSTSSTRRGATTCRSSTHRSRAATLPT